MALFLKPSNCFSQSHTAYLSPQASSSSCQTASRSGLRAWIDGILPTMIPPGTPLVRANLMKLNKCGCNSNKPCATRQCNCKAYGLGIQYFVLTKGMIISKINPEILFIYVLSFHFTLFSTRNKENNYKNGLYVPN